MTDNEIREFFVDSEIYQSSIDPLVDQLHELVSQGKVSDAKIVADQIRDMRMGQQLSWIEQLPSKQSVAGSSPAYPVVMERR